MPPREDGDDMSGPSSTHARSASALGPSGPRARSSRSSAQVNASTSSSSHVAGGGVRSSSSMRMKARRVIASEVPSRLKNSVFALVFSVPLYGTKCENIRNNHRGAAMPDNQAAEVGQRYMEREEVEKKLKVVSEQIRGYAAACERAALVFGGLGGGWAVQRGHLIFKGQPRQERPHHHQRNPSGLGFDVLESEDLEFPSLEAAIKALEEQKELLAKKRGLDRFFASRKT